MFEKVFSVKNISVHTHHKRGKGPSITDF